MFNWPYKDPNEVLDYSIDWSNRLVGNDRITSSTWTIAPLANTTLSITSNTFSNTISTVWVSGGTNKQEYTFTNQVVTAGGRTYDQSVRLKINNK